ncbi:MAG: class I fructose-bisphosphate aldolase [Kiloniellales bacterium]
MNTAELETTAQAMVHRGKGILAADESSGTIEKRLSSVNVPSTDETRRDYREMLFRTKGLGAYISGVILFDETIRQKGADGTPLIELLTGQGIIPGIKVDKGAKALAGAAGEKVTEGLDGLRERYAKYREIGARFAKWRAVITIGDGLPSAYCLEANAHALARYAALAQEADLVPIVEPEVLMDGDHDLERCATATEATLKRVYQALHRHRVHLEGTLLKPNMVLAGKDCPNQPSIDAVARATIRCLRRCVPAAVPGIVFLSGGQTDLDATVRLNAMNAEGPHPWALSFSYGRALQGVPLKEWSGSAENVPAAQAALHHRARMNGAATTGSWSPELEEQRLSA